MLAFHSTESRLAVWTSYIADVFDRPVRHECSAIATSFDAIHTSLQFSFDNGMGLKAVNISFVVSEAKSTENELIVKRHVMIAM
jgi:hypothetical protein